MKLNPLFQSSTSNIRNSRVCSNSNDNFQTKLPLKKSLSQDSFTRTITTTPCFGSSNDRQDLYQLDGTKFTPEKYFRLSKKEIEDIKKKYKSVVIDLDGAILEENVETLVEQNIKMGLALKQSLDKEFGEKNYVFVSIGRSPITIGRIMEFSGVETKYLPLSRIKNVYKIAPYDYYDKKLEYFKGYVMDEQGLTPEKMQNSGKKYLFYDYTFEGKSLKSAEVIMRHNFKLPHDCIQYRSLNGDLLNIFKDSSQECENFIEYNMRLEKNKFFCGTPRLLIDEMEEGKEMLENYRSENAAAYNFWLIDKLKARGLLSLNPEN